MEIYQKSDVDIAVSKHHEPKIPPNSAIIICEISPSLEDVEVFGGNAACVAYLPMAGYSLSYGAHSERLWESVASFLSWN